MRADLLVVPPSSRLARRARVGWAVLTSFAVESVVLALAALPAAAFWSWHLQWGVPPWARASALTLAAVPTYLLFAFGVATLSALSMRLLRWRTPEDVDLPIAAYDWPVLAWARYLISIHVVRVLAGPVFRSTPVWNLYLRLNGARIGRGAWVNSLALMDHALLEIGDGAVIGSDAHISGHTVEAGRLRTGRVRIGCNATIGVGSVVEIGADVGDGAQVGALSVVPKHTHLRPGKQYAGVPVHDLHATLHEQATHGVEIR